MQITANRLAPLTSQSASSRTPATPVAVAAEPTDNVQISGRSSHGSGCSCCMGKAAEAAALQASAGVPAGLPGAYLQITPDLRSRIDNLPVKSDEITHVLYHAECWDGFGARVAAESKLGDKAQYIPVGYKDAMPQFPADAKVAIVDFSYPREQLLELNSKVAGLVVLDHHEKARQALEGLPFVVFEQNRAGAGLAWEYFNAGKPEPELLQYVEDRDLWKWELNSSREVSAALGSYPMDFKVWTGLDTETLKTEGKAILRYKQQLVDGAVSRAVEGTVDGHAVPIASSIPEIRSEVGEALRAKYPDAPFAAIYHINKGKKEWSLRSEEGAFDVNEVAKKFGGGGHKAAAGFRDAGPAEPTDIKPPKA